MPRQSPTLDSSRLARRRLLLAAAAGLLAPALRAQPLPPSRDTLVKAAFLHKFASFVEWPPGAFARPEAAFVIGLLGADDVAAALEPLVADRTVHGRPVQVRRMRRSDSFAGLHVLFIGQADAARLPELLAALRGQPLLTVTDSENALSQGSMINFIAEESRVRFDIALLPAERGQLRISSRLLGVARKVVAP